MSLSFGDGSFDADADRGPIMVRVSVAMMCLSGVGICGRFLVRRLTKQPLLWDDWSIVVALIFSWGCCILPIIGESFTRTLARANMRLQVSILRILVGMRNTQLQRAQ